MASVGGAMAAERRVPPGCQGYAASGPAACQHVSTSRGGPAREGKVSSRVGAGKPQLAQPTNYAVLLYGTIGQDRIVEESVFRFTHSLVRDWLRPGVPPTGKRIEVAAVGIIQFREGKIAHEHLYWDQASVLVQLDLVDEHTLPVAGVESARRLLDPSVPMNRLLRRGHGTG